MKQVIACLLILVVPFGSLCANTSECSECASCDAYPLEANDLYKKNHPDYCCEHCRSFPCECIAYQDPNPGYVETKYFSDKNHPRYCCDSCGCFPCECLPYAPPCDPCCDPCPDLICATDPCYPCAPCAPCAPICGTECGVSICAIAAGIIAIVAVAALIVSVGDDSSTEHSHLL